MLGELSFRWLCVVVLILLFRSPLAAQDATGPKRLKEPIASFVFDAALGNTAPPVTVWYYRPNEVVPNTRVVFLMHGSSRTGREARDLGSSFAKRHGYILLAPEFSEQQYPNNTYAFGNMLSLNGRLLPESAWAFTTIERVFDLVRSEFHMTTQTYDIVGHSAGGQLVHRLVLFAPQLRFRRAVASSPGRYAFPTMTDSFPYGFNGLSGTSTLADALARDFVLLLGDLDTTDTEREPAAMRQGANRFARGLRFFATAAEEANRLNVRLGWRLQILHGADHTPGPAVQAALKELMK